MNNKDNKKKQNSSVLSKTCKIYFNIKNYEYMNPTRARYSSNNCQIMVFYLNHNVGFNPMVTRFPGLADYNIIDLHINVHWSEIFDEDWDWAFRL